MNSLWINWSNGEDTRPPNSVNHNIYWLNLFSITMCCIRSKVTPGLEQKIAPENYKVALINNKHVFWFDSGPRSVLTKGFSDEYLDEDKR